MDAFLERIHRPGPRCRRHAFRVTRGLKSKRRQSWVKGKLRGGRAARVSEVIIMAKKCEVCGKGPQFANNVSHANNRSPRRFNPNLQAIRVQQPSGAARRMRVCTRCIKGGKVAKAA